MKCALATAYAPRIHALVIRFQVVPLIAAAVSPFAAVMGTVPLAVVMATVALVQLARLVGITGIPTNDVIKYLPFWTK